MAYPDQPFGFTPIRHKTGAPYNGASNPYFFDAAESEGDGLWFIGDPVIVDGTSNTALIEVPGMGTFPPGTLPGVTRATAADGNLLSGVIVAFGADTRDSSVHRQDVTQRLVWIADDPDLVFIGQVDAALATTAVGSVTNIVLDTSGSTSTGRSGAEVDASIAQGDATKQLLITRFVNDPLNTANAVGNRVEFIITLHTMGIVGGIAGI